MFDPGIGKVLEAVGPLPAQQPIEATLHGAGFAVDVWQAPTGIRCVRLMIAHPNGWTFFVPLGVLQATQLAEMLERRVDEIRKGWNNGSD